MHRPVEDTGCRLSRTDEWPVPWGLEENEEADGRGPSLWDRILGLIEQDLAERRSRKLFVEVRGEPGSYRKEIEELSTAERRSLHPDLREHVVEQLLDRYLAKQGRVDLVEKRRAYTKKIEDLTPEDLPALVGADRQRTEEHREEREEFTQEARSHLETGQKVFVARDGRG